MSWSIWICYNPSILSQEVRRDNDIWHISIRRIMGQIHSGLVSNLTMVSTYRYIGILTFSIALCKDVYTIVFIFAFKIVHMTPLLGSYLLVFCLYLTLQSNTLMLDSLGLRVSKHNDLLLLSLNRSDGLLQLCCLLMTLLPYF